MLYIAHPNLPDEMCSDLTGFLSIAQSQGATYIFRYFLWNRTVDRIHRNTNNVQA